MTSHTWAQAPVAAKKDSAHHHRHHVAVRSPAPAEQTEEVSPLVAEALRVPGRLLEPPVREAMKARFSFDFDQVRVHTDGSADAAARSLDAAAFTCGQDVFFAAGRYRPETERGLYLLAHELAHTVQQRGSPPIGHIDHPLRADYCPQNPLEREADAAGRAVAEGRTLAADSLTVGSPAVRGRIACLIRSPERSQGGPVTTPASLIEAIAAGIARKLQADPEDSAGAVRRQVTQLVPPVRDAVLGQVHVLVAPAVWERLNQLLGTPVPAETQTTPAPLEAEQAPSPPAAEAVKPPAPTEAGPEETAPKEEVKATAEPKQLAPLPVSPPAASTEAPAAEAPVAALTPEERPVSPPGPAPAPPAPAVPAARASAAAPSPVPMGPAAAEEGETAAPVAEPEAPAPEEKEEKSRETGAASVPAEAEAGPAPEGTPGKAPAEVIAEEPATAPEVVEETAAPQAEAAQPEPAEPPMPGLTEEVASPPSVQAPAPEPEAPALPPVAAEVPSPVGEVQESPPAEVESQPEVVPETATAPEEAPSAAPVTMAAVDMPPAGGGDEGAPSGGRGGGGAAIPEPPAPAVSDVAQQDPAQAMAAVSNLPPGQMTQALGGVAAAATRSVGEQRQDLAQTPPQAETPPPGPAAGEEATPAPPVEADPLQVERVAAAQAAPVAKPEPLPPPAPPPAANVAGPRVGGDPQGQVSAADAEALQNSVRQLPTTDPDLALTAGPPPTVALEGDADPAHARDQRAALQRSTADAQVRGQQDAAAPMGENAIYPDAPQETLRAEVTPGGAAPAPPAAGGAAPRPTAVAVGGDTEAASLVAQEQHGDDIRAAAVKAQGDLVAGRQQQETRVAQERKKADQDVAAESRAAADKQRLERQGALKKVADHRKDWTGEQTQLVEKANVEADQASQKGEKDVTREQTEAEAKAREHVETGNREASTARQDAEREAGEKRAEAEQKSSGVLDWFADKARAFFDGIKNAIKWVFEKARKLVREAIAKAQRLAAAVIDKARQAIVAALRWVGDRLIALGDKLLKDFPGLRDRFRKAINAVVDTATRAVNAMAAGLTKAIQKVLDLLGKALDACLGLLEKLYLAVVDVVAGVVQGYIKAAQAVLQAIGVFAALVKDVAANPLQWIRNLGAAVVDGIRHHLWKALKDAIKNWFNQKVEEVLGLGLMIWNLLKSGGLKLADIGKMAWQGIKQAIPMVLIRILIEKLVAMIVPAAGALLAIIEGLQAAWGTVSRILQAIERFVAFLKAVKGGQAGLLFAQAVAAAAVVVIDFVANWLLKRLRKPAGAVAKSLRKIAQKIGAALKKVGGAIKHAVMKAGAAIKRGLAKLGAGLKKGAGGVGRRLAGLGRALARTRIGKAFARGVRAVRAAFQRAKDRFKAWRERRRQRRQQNAADRLRRAVEAIRPEVQNLLRGGVGRTWLRARLQFWRLRYRLSALALENNSRIVARVNPGADVEKVAPIALGTALEPILAQVEEAFLQLYEESRAAEYLAGELGEPSPENAVPVISEIEDILAYRRAGRARGGLYEGFFRGESMPLRGPGRASFLGVVRRGEQPRPLLSATFIPQTGTEPVEYAKLRKAWKKSGAPSLDTLSPSLQAILVLERARAPGMLPTIDLAAALGGAGKATTEEIALGALAPMAVKGSGRAAEEDVAGRPSTGRGKKAKETAKARRVRRERIGNIFKRLRQVLRDSKGDVLGMPGAQAARLASALENWLRLHFGPKQARDPAALEEASLVLGQELLAFLRTFRG
jgi:hypothetical protein